MFSKLSRNLKRILVSGWCAAAAIILNCPALATSSLSAGLTGQTVEQVRARMPQVEVYFYTEEELPQNVQIEAYLDGEVLSYTGMAKSDTFGTDYFILLDSSGSIRPGHLAAAKDEIVYLAENLGQEDSLTLITFGDEVELQTALSRDADQIEAQLEKVDGRDQNTCFYEAIVMGMRYARTAGGDNRQVMLIVSDGLEDTGSNGITREEVEELLWQSNMPVYALCADHAQTAQQEEFGRFARATGGELLAFGSQDADAVWKILTDWLDGAVRVCFEARSNKIDGMEHSLLIKLKSGSQEQNYTHPVILWDWIPDEVQPEVASFEYLSEENALKICFSEPVLGAEKTENYILKDEKQIYSPVSVTCLEDGRYCLTLPENLSSGQYLLTFSGICDDSMEHNPLAQEQLTFQKKLSFSDLPGILLGGAALLMGITLAAVLFLRLNKRSAKESPKKIIYEVQHVEAKPQTAVSSPEHNVPAVRLVLEIAGGAQAGQRLEIRIDRSAIWGRSSRMCDTCFQDPKISHQHCALEVRENELWMTDLGSQNGTYLNGIRLNGSHRLQPEELIRIGDTSLRVKEIFTEIQ